MRKGIDERFRKFHAENPHVLRELERLIRNWVAAGNGKCSIGMMWEVLRWQSKMRTNATPYRLNDNYRSRYVRLLIERNPEWDGLFDVRELRAV